MRLARVWFCLCLGSVTGLGAGAEPVDVSAEGAAWFTKHVRPLLERRCFECHSHAAGKIKGGLALDSREGLGRGGNSGPAVVAGRADQSLLLRAVRRIDPDLQMPPEGAALSGEEIGVLERWIRLGAPDPRPASSAAGTGDSAGESARGHWSFQPVRRPAIPAVQAAEWVRTPIDAFILAKLEARGLAPSPPADKRSLLRRAAFDLTGLPPTVEEVEAFLADDGPEAFERVVDRLLASPHYGERWGRYWLDVARYADTTGERAVRNSDTRYPYAYTYRDYVIESFNADLPYDRFVLEQIAADLLPEGRGPRALAALGFLTVGKRFQNAVDDVLDDRIDVVTRGLQGLSVSCARCHDHKFDPIPTEDYYSLHGVFASCVEPSEGPVLEVPEPKAVYEAFAQELAARRAELARFREETYERLHVKVRRQTGDYLRAIHEFGRQKGGMSANNFYRSRELDPNVARNWERELERRRRGRDPVFAAWFALEALGTEGWAEQAARLCEGSLSGDTPGTVWNKAVAEALREKPVSDMAGLAAAYGRVFAEADRRWEEAEALASVGSGTQRGRPRLEGLADPEWEAVRQVLHDRESPARLDERSLRRLVNQKTQGEENALVRKINDLIATHPGSPARAMVLEDAAKPRDSYVYLRGERSNRGPVVPRRYLEVVSGKERKPFGAGSGRLGLARAIASGENPLTARVLVNRVWAWHFGAGLVGTPSDFGLRGERPTHPELLDWLAGEFMREGWSIKKLHRGLMLSSVYQQGTQPQQRHLEVDPGNTLWWRMNRRRLDFEATRDTLLALSRQLDGAMGGRPEDLVRAPASRRRTVYGRVDRLDLPELFLTFDFANPEMSSPQRYETTVPQQALFLMNNPFVVEQAQALVRRPEFAELGDDASRVRWLYRSLYQRSPGTVELEWGLEFLNDSGATSVRPAPVRGTKQVASARPRQAQRRKATPAAMSEDTNGLTACEQYAQVLLLANELVYLE